MRKRTGRRRSGFFLDFTGRLSLVYLDDTMRNRLALVILLCCCMAPLSLASGQTKAVARVKIYVQHQDKAVVEQMTSYLGRELRSLRDVEITTDDSGYVIELTMVTLPSNSATTGYAVSALITKQSTCDGYNKATELLTDSVAIIWAGKLQDFAAQMVAKFDVEVLDPKRRLLSSKNILPKRPA